MVNLNFVQVLVSNRICAHECDTMKHDLGVCLCHTTCHIGSRYFGVALKLNNSIRKLIDGIDRNFIECGHLKFIAIYDYKVSIRSMLV